jgi:DNA-binding NarL/FixJ family response regulator
MDIIITDDHKVVREGLAKIFSLQKEFNVIGEAASIRELFDLLEKKVPDIITLDISLPDRSGLDSIKDIKALYPDVKIMVFSIYQDETFGHRSLLMGADGYLSKSADPKEIVSAIKKIYSGGRYFTQ